MQAKRVERGDLAEVSLEGMVLCRDVRGNGGEIALRKGRILSADDVALLERTPWRELHVAALDAGDVHEDAAGDRLARAVVGAGVTVRAPSGGHHPLAATTRGLLRVQRDALRQCNTIDGICVYTQYDGHVCEVGEIVARAKVTPFAIAAPVLARAEALARSVDGLVQVRPFQPVAVGVVVEETLREDAMRRFHDALREKVEWFGASLLEPRFVATEVDAVAGAMTELVRDGARVLVVAGAKSMDPLDAAFLALERTGARMLRHGVPAHPGSLFWLARLGDVPVLGMPTCGLFSTATVFDLVLPPVLAGEAVSADTLVELGEGGLLSRDTAFRFPPYRKGRGRGELEETGG